MTNILYVEDDQHSRKVVDMLLRRVMGLPAPTIFEDSTNFMERVKSLPVAPDIILLDIQMQPYDGYEMLDMLRRDAMFCDTMIVAMTANVMLHDVHQLRQAGFSGLIGKPILKENFPELITRLVSGEAVWYIP